MNAEHDLWLEVINRTVTRNKIAAALREAKASAFEEARARAQIEVNACTSQVKAAAPRDRRIHEAARGVAQVIVRWCGLAAEGCRSAQDAPATEAKPCRDCVEWQKRGAKTCVRHSAEPSRKEE